MTQIHHIQKLKASRGLLFGVLVGVGVLGSLANWQDIFLQGHIVFLDPDCYSRMTRVATVLSGDSLSVRFHDFENAPDGILTHATSPLDWLIAVLSRIIAGFGFSRAPDLAGAFVSPILGLICLLVVAAWSWCRKFGASALALAAFSPMFAHGFSIGRPDHQSLALLLVVAAWICELGLWKRYRHAGVCSAIAWGLALWVSLFEPLILLVLTLLLRGVVLRASALPGRSGWRPAAAFAAIVLVALVVDGWRFSMPDAEVRTLFIGWSQTIGELQGAGLASMASWVGWLGLLVPILLIGKSWKDGDSRLLAGGVLIGILFVLTLFASRWGIYYVAATALGMPFALRACGPTLLACTLFLVSLWPVAAVWERQIFPEGNDLARRIETRAENLLLLDVADRLRQMPEGNVLAPWWISPALAYWSGHHFVAGSSHQSLPGIGDSARFFLARDSGEALEILQRRNVRIVIADDADRVVRNSAQILRRSPPPNSMASALSGGEGPRLPSMHLVYSNKFFKIYTHEIP